jgi:hypothetical protein
MAMLSCTSLQSVASNTTSVWSIGYNDRCNDPETSVKFSKQHFRDEVQELLPECDCDMNKCITEEFSLDEHVANAISNTVSSFLATSHSSARRPLGKRPACIGQESPSVSTEDISTLDQFMSDTTLSQPTLCCVKISGNKSITRKFKTLRKQIKSMMCASTV